jgi:hypothetical protein
MDWDEFMKIPGCSSGEHTDIKPVRPRIESAPATETSSPALISEKVEPTKSEISETPAPPVVKKDQIPFRTSSGLFRCRHAGCLKEYDPDLNSESACEYHEGSAGFRDTKKFWSCCGASSYDWDEFMKIPKCKVGCHEPKLVDA